MPKRKIIIQQYLIYLYFSSFSVMFSFLFISMPEIMQKLGLAKNQLGFALALMSIGSISGAIFNFLIRSKNNNTSRHTFFLGIIFITLSTILHFGKTYSVLCFFFFFMGLSSALLNIQMNKLALVFERKFSKEIIGKCHALFSIGAFLGAFLENILFELRIPYQTFIVFFAAVFILIIITLYTYSLTSYELDAQRQTLNKNLAINDRSLVYVLILAFSCLLVEDAVSSWGGIFLFEIKKIEYSKTGYGYFLFSFFMLLGRFFLDKLNARFVFGRIVRIFLLLTILGLIALLVGQGFLSIISFCIIGLGLSVIVPNLYKFCDLKFGTNGIKLLTGVGSLAFLCSPIIMGLISEQFSLLISFMILLFSIIMVYFIVFGKFEQNSTSENETKTLSQPLSKL